MDKMTKTTKRAVNRIRCSESEISPISGLSVTARVACADLVVVEKFRGSPQCIYVRLAAALDVGQCRPRHTRVVVTAFVSRDAAEKHLWLA